VTVEFYAPMFKDSATVRMEKFEVRELKKRKLYRGSVSVDWNNGIDVKYKTLLSAFEGTVDFIYLFIKPFFWDIKPNSNKL
jgi:hypothetical protein